MKTPFLVNQRPFFILGGQVHNSSGYSPQAMESAWLALDRIRANTAEVPVYWEQVEPHEGQFTFDHLDRIIQGARERALKLVLLWFATWKNGSMQYAPEWVKTNPDRFWRVQTPGGTETWVLSSHCAETWQADRSAFCSLLEHIRRVDLDQTVIGIQIENEPGILGSVRDYSPAAEIEFNNPIPEALGTALTHLGEGPLKASWNSTGARRDGTWPQVFGQMAAEAFTTWSIARYIDRLAQAGKTVSNLPMVVNVWLAENGWQLPGVNYPSGGAVSGMLGLWKIATPNIDLIAPDIYIEPQAGYNAICTAYKRADNPLFIPESGWGLSNALNLFEAVATFHTVGYAVFGIESLLNQDGSPRKEALPVIESFHILRSMLPLVTKYHATGKVQAVIQREFMGEQILDLGLYQGMARFTGSSGQVFTDFRHRPTGEDIPRGRGLVILANPRELFLAGSGFRLMLKEKLVDERRLFTQASDQFDGPLTRYLRVEEGHFTPDGEWIVDRLRNGDEITNGLWVAPDCGVIHALLV